MADFRRSLSRLRGETKGLAQRLCSAPPLRRVLTWHGPRSSSAFAPTFDDGPNPEFTPSLLELLRAKGARGTFFLLGQRVEEFPELARTIADEGHEIGIHGYDHTSRDLPAQARRTREILRELSVETRLFRPPRGQWTLPMVASMSRMQLSTVLWSLDSHDSRRASGHTALRDETGTVRGGDVLLFHDDNELCLRDLPQVLESAAHQGLVSQHVSTLLQL